ncbi:MAG: glycosyltransferase [Acidobacteriaceae bacterium]
MRVALVHHWFVGQAGGERVAEVIGEIFPSADVFTLVATPEGIPRGLAGRKITTSLLQRIPGATSYHRHLLPLYPYAVEQLDLTPYDLILSSDSGPVKGVLTRQDAVHICYCHSPMRYLWDGYHSYAANMGFLTGAFFRIAAHYVRNWEFGAAQRVDHFLANSHYVARRIEHFYRRNSTVIHPPVETRLGLLSAEIDNSYLCVGRLVPYKQTSLIVQACTRLERKLTVVGIGPELRALQKLAGPTIRFVGALSQDALWRAYARSRALIFAADEDFGLVPLEAQACGRPVIAYGIGGSLETVRAEGSRYENVDEPTGIYFHEQTVDSLCTAIEHFEAQEKHYNPLAIQEFARGFDTSIFKDAFASFVNQCLSTSSSKIR